MQKLLSTNLTDHLTKSNQKILTMSTEEDNQYHAMGPNGSSGSNNASSDAPGLLPYRNIRGRMTAALSLLIPFGIIAFFVAFCATADGKYELDAMVKVTGFQRVILILHGAYFIVLPFSFELDINNLPFPGCPDQYKFGKSPPRPDNLFWMMSCLSGELFFVAAVIYFLMASQSNVPRWSVHRVVFHMNFNKKLTKIESKCKL